MSAMPRDGFGGAAGNKGSGRGYDEVCIVVSDLHQGEGRKVRVEYGGSRGIRRALKVLAHAVRRRPEEERYELIDNPLEAFRFDGEFADLLDLAAERYSDAGTLTLKLLGDVFDPLTVTWQGRCQDPPYEDVGADKMRRIIAGHPVVFDALARFLKRPNCRIDVYTGNHDLFLSWPSVRELVRDRIAGGDGDLEARLRFIGYEQDFRSIERGVLYTHGMDAEPHNAIDPKKAVVRDVLGMKLKKPIINTPIGSFMFVDLAIPLKLRNPLLGRLREDMYVWKHAARRLWLWGAYAFVRLAWYFIYANFFAFWDFRRKANTRKILDIVLATTTKHPMDKYTARLLREHEDVRVVVCGHSHKWKRESSDHGTSLNTGNWTVSYRMYEREFERSWKRFGRLEPYWLTLKHFFRTGKVRFASRMIRFVAMLAFIAALGTFVVGGFWPVDTLQIKVLVGIQIVFIMLVGMFRIFSAEPIIEDDTHLTFALIRHREDGTLKADLMEYLPEERDFRECV